MMTIGMTFLSLAGPVIERVTNTFGMRIPEVKATRGNDMGSSKKLTMSHPRLGTSSETRSQSSFFMLEAVLDGLLLIRMTSPSPGSFIESPKILN